VFGVHVWGACLGASPPIAIIGSLCSAVTTTVLLCGNHHCTAVQDTSSGEAAEGPARKGALAGLKDFGRFLSPGKKK
jgi:hypothetical protein